MSLIKYIIKIVSVKSFDNLRYGADLSIGVSSPQKFSKRLNQNNDDKFKSLQKAKNWNTW